MDYEIELALIIEKKCKNISEEEAMDVIFGYMILNDVSMGAFKQWINNLQEQNRFDGFAPCEPWITTKDEIDDPQNLKLTTKINGQIKTKFYNIKYVHKNSINNNQYLASITLEPGDIISTGTAAGVTLNNPNIPYLKNGDHIEMEIEKLGTIQNKVNL